MSLVYHNHRLTGYMQLQIKRGFNENQRPIHIEDAYVIDAPRSGRSQKQSTHRDIIISKVRLDRYKREKSCADLAGDLSLLGLKISATKI